VNDDRQPLDATILDAVAKHGAAVDASVPNFAAILAGRQRHTRRWLASATAAVALIGVVGVVVATNRTQEPADAVAETLDEPGITTTRDTAADETTTTTTTRPTMPAPSLVVPPITSLAEYFCTDPLGADQLGRSLFGSCEPAPGQTDSDYACTDQIGTDDTGRQRFATCEAVGQLGPIPGADPGAPFDNRVGIPVRATTYTVQPGDYAFRIANQFCVSLSDLEAANGWSDSSREFPSPDTEILIPRFVDLEAEGCEAGSYIIEPDDTTRIGVADTFCVTV